MKTCFCDPMLDFNKHIGIHLYSQSFDGAVATPDEHNMASTRSICQRHRHWSTSERRYAPFWEL